MDTVHPTDDELVEHFCGNAEPADGARIDAHVHECARCRQAWDDLGAALTMVNDAVPEPPDGFERVMWARVQPALHPAPRWGWRLLVPAGALAATVLVLIGANRTPEIASQSTAAVQTTAADATKANLKQNERVLFTALDEHFQQTEALLVELRNAPDVDSFDVERVTADDLIAAGRLYRQTAEYTGHAGLVRVLDDLEPVLVEVARGSDRMPERDREWLRTRIEDDNLLFKVRAVNSDIRERVAHNDN